MAETDPRLNLPKCESVVPPGDFSLPTSAILPPSGDGALVSAECFMNLKSPVGEVRATGRAVAVNDFTFAAEVALPPAAPVMSALKSTTHTAVESATLDLRGKGLTY